MPLSLDDIKQVFFHCHHKDPDGFYADEVDIIEFGRKMVAFDRAQRHPMTEDQILDLMLSVDLTSNGDALLDRVTALVRAVEKIHGIKKAPG